MKPLLHATLVALCVLNAPVAIAADTKPPVSPPGTTAPKPSLAGNFAGTWRNSDSGGSFRLKLTQDGATWTAEAAFTFEGAEIATKLKAIKVDGTKVELVLVWEIPDSAGQSTLTGELKGDTLSGTFQSKVGTEITAGTWTATRT